MTQVKYLKGNLYNACLCPYAESWLMQNGGLSGHMCMWNIYSASWKQIRKYNLPTLHISFNTAFTLLLNFTCMNLIFRSFDHEKRSWREQLFSKNLKKNYLSAVKLAEREIDVLERELNIMIFQLNQEKPNVKKRKGKFKRSRLKLKDGHRISLPSGLQCFFPSSQYILSKYAGFNFMVKIFSIGGYFN